ncbi:LDLR chaperone boca isoform X2 [Aphidius gifuensis]|uniref:LDLR chaperone boca isoform X2 n=1 Tax=Aphidius gifuensis TaxID=684658 RepID=UPI001CDBA977|nr:LDLR chaperone boca isoform X2 [Aphidius gifuensis]
MKFSVIILLSFYLILSVYCEEKKKTLSWKDKNIMDMNDADFERLLDQWEENDEEKEELAPDELPEHLRPAKKIDFSKIDTTNPDELVKATKTGKSLMMFVDVKQDIPDDEAEKIMKIWQTSLQNNHIVIDRYPIEGKRSIFMFKEGSQSIDAKNFLIEQPELDHVSLEGQTYHGKYSSQKSKGSKKSEL